MKAGCRTADTEGFGVAAGPGGQERPRMANFTSKLVHVSLSRSAPALQVLEKMTQEIESMQKSSSDDISSLQKALESQQVENKKLGHGYEKATCEKHNRTKYLLMPRDDA